LSSRPQFNPVQTASICPLAYSSTRPRPGRFVLSPTVRLSPDPVHLSSRPQSTRSGMDRFVLSPTGQLGPGPSPFVLSPTGQPGLTGSICPLTHRSTRSDRLDLSPRLQFNSVQTGSICPLAYSSTESGPSPFVLSPTIQLGPDRLDFVIPPTVQLGPDPVHLSSRPQFNPIWNESVCSPAYVQPGPGQKALHSTSGHTAPSSTARRNLCAGRGRVSEARLLSCPRAPPRERARNRSACNHAAARKGRPTALPDQASRRPHRTQTLARPV
jgi:hypothetical protein